VELTHLDEESGKACMVNVAHKTPTERKARARAIVHMQLETLEKIRSNVLKKGDALGVARIAGIMAAKRTHDLIPLCHPIGLAHVGVDFEFGTDAESITVVASAATTAQTGVEMEALTAVTIAALTIYDMVKAVDRSVSIESVRLLDKSGGHRGDYHWTE
jgi:cyclic pyranopterin phosphate synthase